LLFTSPEFIFFFAIVLLVYYCLSSHTQNVFLIIASYFFYGWWDWRFCGLLLFSTLLNYFSALIVDSKSPHRRIYLWGNITGNLAVLGFFKYYNFFAESLATALSHLGIHPYLPVLHIILPIGISFYTFQLMGYTIDVYRGRVRATREFITVAVFMCFFPQLLAGPIARAERMIPQFQKCRTINADKISSGLLLILLGFFKKIAIADAVASIVNDVFANASTASWPELVGGLWFFAIQLYCDFSGYSDIARGISRLLGFELMENFRQPFLSHNITEFWRRWHISLSTWVLDYLYMPLVLRGIRKGKSRENINMMITMILMGLWHGAAWNFVFFGCLHGFYIVLHTLVARGRRIMFNPHGASKTQWIQFIMKVFITFNFVCLSLLFFREKSLEQIANYGMGILMLRGGLEGCGSYIAKLFFFCSLVLMIDIPQYLKNDHTIMLKWPRVLQGVVYGFMIILMVFLSSGKKIPFIYFQF
jgi:D-alanyl-lipoteichoic acid acyltransferase DltB (MBOAT superfamily)